MDHYFAVAGGAVRFGVEGATANANADPPFGFAQGRLFGDDNQKATQLNCKARAKTKADAGSLRCLARRDCARLRSR